MTNLRAAGYRPAQVDEIYLTHRGQDHIGGLTIGRERAFPNAVVRGPKNEFDVFFDPAKSAALLAEAHKGREGQSLAGVHEGPLRTPRQGWEVSELRCRYYV